MDASFPEARKIFISQIRGRVQSYVAREKESLFKMVKYIRTMCKKYEVTVEELQRILTEVKNETVVPFLNSSKGVLYQPIRLTRFNKLCQELGLKVD